MLAQMLRNVIARAIARSNPENNWIASPQAARNDGVIELT